jgi:hypothetical protein
MYTPLYFAVYPLAGINVDLGDYFYAASGQESESNLRQKQETIASVGRISFVVDAFLLPLAFGTILGATIDGRELVSFLFVFLYLKICEIRKSFSALPDYAWVDRDYYKSKKLRLVLHLLYGGYLALSVVVIWRSYAFSEPYFERRDYGELVGAAMDWTLIQIALPVVLALTLGSFSKMLVTGEREIGP